MFEQQNLQILIAVTTVVLVFVVMLIRRNTPTEVLFILALTLFVVCGVISPSDAWQSFSDPAVIAIAGLLVVTEALRTTGLLDFLGRSLLGSVKSQAGALARLSVVVIVSSAFLLNTAIVAMLMPLVISWCRRMHVAPSKLLLPISYLAILGGTCTLVGTSTNLVVKGNLEQISGDAQAYVQGAKLPADAQRRIERYPKAWLSKNLDQLRPLEMTDISPVGIPCALAGAIFLIVIGTRLLPDRTEMLDSLEEHRREYLVEMMVAAKCPLVDKTVEEGGLRNLPGLFLIEIDRDGEIIGPVGPTDRIRLNDRLVFTGIVATIVDLEKIPGLVPAADINYEIAPEKSGTRSLVEVVLSPTSPLVGTTIREANFRQHYGSAVVAVHRNGTRLPSKIGDIELTPGDTLLLQTRPGFVRLFRNRPDFYLVSGVEGGDSRRWNKLRLAAGITLCLIAWLFMIPFLPTFLGTVYPQGIPAALQSASVAIMVAVAALIVTRCLSIADTRRAIDWPLLLTVGAAIGVGKAMNECGASDKIAQLIVDSCGVNPYVGLALIFVVTVCFTEMISNVAVAAMMFYVAVGLASTLEASPRPFIMAVTLGASLSFVSPIGYQTNLMVMGPGGYRPIDYVRTGLPLSLFVGTIAVVLIPIIWPF